MKAKKQAQARCQNTACAKLFLKAFLKRHIKTIYRKGIFQKEMSRHFFFQATLRFQPSKCALRLEMSYFRVSATAEKQLLPFFVRPPWRKCSFSHFKAFSRGGNAVLPIFYFSAMAEMIFLLFFTRPPWRKTVFRHFLTFIHG